MNLFNIYVEEAKKCLEDDLVFPAYDMVLKASHAFNVLDAQKVISPKKRQNFIQTVSRLAKLCCESYVKTKSDYDIIRKKRV